jgi:dienelactone hydrolase
VGENQFEGVFFYDDADVTPRRAILVCHEWWGLNDYAKRRAEQLAQMGYVALAVDVYGKGVSAKTVEEAAKMSKALKDDRPALRARVSAALAALKARKEVDPKKIGAIGYCFGGTTALELARSGADVVGVVAFHAGLATPTPDDAKNIKGKVLLCHGADDPFVPMPELNGFVEEMKKAGVNYEIDIYGGAVHTFSNPAAGNDPAKGQAYNEQADKRSWARMRDFFAEVFR